MQRYFSNKLENNKFILSDADLYHIRTVMRFKDSEKIEVVYESNPYLCKLNIELKNIEIEVVKKLEKKEDKLPYVVLLIPLLKEPKFDLILQKSTELGVSEIIPVVMSRSIIKLDNEKQEKKLERWNKILKEASEQSFRNDIPLIREIKQIKDLNKIDGLKIVCSTSNLKNNIKYVLKNNSLCDKINVLIGPEGGITDTEEKKLEDMGFIPTSLGNRIMRVETVPIYILSLINYESME